MNVMERVRNVGASFRKAVHLSSRADAERRAFARAAVKAQGVEVSRHEEESLQTWVDNCAPNDHLLPWLKKQIKVSRTNARAQISSPYANAYYQGTEDGLRMVAALFTKDVDR